jgi:uncharacterized protein YjbI with pentapeptide repeats
MIGSGFESSQVASVTFKDCEIQRANFTCVDFVGGGVSDVRFLNCNLRESVFVGSTFKYFQFIKCDLRGVDFTRTQFVAGCSRDRFVDVIEDATTAWPAH